MDKRAQREAAERIEQGIERYAAGDVAASLREFEEALRLHPGNPRALQCLAWVRDLQSGKRKLEDPRAVDDATLEALSETLGAATQSGEWSAVGDEDRTREKPASRVPVEVSREVSPWDPVPLTPGREARLRAEEVANARPSGDEQPTARVPPLAADERPPAPKRPPPEPPPPIAPPSSSTLLGIAPPAETSLLVPERPRRNTAPRPLHEAESTRSQTREWRATPTGTNLPPLDVPELTDEQVQELLALDGVPQLQLEPDEGPPRLAGAADPGLEPAAADPGLEPAADPGLTIELDAEPDASPVVPPTSIPLRPKDDTALDAQLLESALQPFAEFDATELTPTRDRRDLLDVVNQAERDRAPASGDEDLTLSPLAVPRRLDDGIDEGGTNPTNPFIRQRLVEYGGYSAPPRVDELPLPPGASLERGRDTAETPALEPVPGLGEALDRGDAEAALDLAEAFVAEVGGLDVEAAGPQLWLLERAYELVVGPLARVPTHGEASPDLDPRAAFLLSRVDGMTSVEDLLDVSGMPRIEALRLLALLTRRGVLQFR